MGRFGTFLHVAREGWLLIAFVAGFGAALYAVSANVLMLLLGLLGVLVLMLYFREPDRRIPPNPLGILAPADGRIVHCRECHDPFLDRAAIRIGIVLDRFGAYYLRAPIEGALLEVRKTAHCTNAEKASWIQTDEGDDVVFIVSDGMTFGARPCQQAYGNRVGQGRRCGSRRLARRIDLYLPAESRVETATGDHVRAGTSLIATLVHNPAQAALQEAHA